MDILFIGTFKFALTLSLANFFYYIVCLRKTLYLNAVLWISSVEKVHLSSFLWMIIRLVPLYFLPDCNPENFENMLQVTLCYLTDYKGP